jgi:Iodothyronine deiodinase
MERWFESGTPVPDFTLPDVQTGALVQFYRFRASRPTVLILGSFGCNLFCYQLGPLRRLHEHFKSKAAFLFVQVKDAGHPLPSRLLQAFDEAGMKEETLDNRLQWTCLHPVSRMGWTATSNHFTAPSPSGWSLWRLMDELRLTPAGARGRSTKRTSSGAGILP